MPCILGIVAWVPKYMKTPLSRKSVAIHCDISNALLKHFFLKIRNSKDGGRYYCRRKSIIHFTVFSSLTAAYHNKKNSTTLLCFWVTSLIGAGSHERLPCALILSHHTNDVHFTASNTGPWIDFFASAFDWRWCQRWFMWFFAWISLWFYRRSWFKALQ